MLNTFLTFAIRSSLNLTIVSMVKPIEHVDNNHSIAQVCPEWSLSVDIVVANVSSKATAASVATFEWSESLQGTILGAYFYGYTITNVNAGQLGALIGSRRLLAISMSISGIFTFIIPFVAPINVWFVFVARFLVGAAQVYC